MRRCYFFILLVLILGCGFAPAQEDSSELSSTKPRCSYHLFPGNFRAEFHVSGNTLENDRNVFDIQWLHHESGNDTFTIQNSVHNENWIFTTSNSYRELRIPSRGVVRAIASHHLRERIFQTALRLDDLELLAHGNFFCLDPISKQKNHLFTSQSSMWYNLEWQNQMPTGLKVFFSGLHKTKRTIFVNTWPIEPANLLSVRFVVQEGQRFSAEITLDHWQAFPQAVQGNQDSLFWNPWKFRTR